MVGHAVRGAAKTSIPEREHIGLETCAFGSSCGRSQLLHVRQTRIAIAVFEGPLSIVSQVGDCSDSRSCRSGPRRVSRCATDDVRNLPEVFPVAEAGRTVTAVRGSRGCAVVDTDYGPKVDEIRRATADCLEQIFDCGHCRLQREGRLPRIATLLSFVFILHLRVLRPDQFLGVVRIKNDRQSHPRLSVFSAIGAAGGHPR
jgi:hypothetical protein